MKNVLKKMGFLPFWLIVVVGCGSNPSTAAAIDSNSTAAAIDSNSSGLALDTAIEQAALRIENAFAAGTEIALVSVSSPSTQFSEYVLTYLETVLVNNGKLAIVDRSNLDRIREEQGFQLSGEVSDESAKAIGQLLGAGAIVTGSLVNLGDAYRLNLKAINVETARIAASYAGDIVSSPRVQTLLASGGPAASGRTAAAQTAQPRTAASGTTAQAQAAPATAEPVQRNPDEPYKIGDTGPGGGTVFYVEGTSGMEVSRLLGTFNWEDAVKTAQDYRGGDKADWHLPSQIELDMVYQNLHKSGKLGMGSYPYWSSSWSNPYPCFQDFSDGRQNNINGSQIFSVRAVRTF